MIEVLANCRQLLIQMGFRHHEDLLHGVATSELETDDDHSHDEYQGVLPCHELKIGHQEGFEHWKQQEQGEEGCHLLFRVDTRFQEGLRLLVLAKEELSIDGGSEFMEFGFGEEKVVEGGGGWIEAELVVLMTKYFDNLEHRNIYQYDSPLLFRTT